MIPVIEDTGRLCSLELTGEEIFLISDMLKDRCGLVALRLNKVLGDYIMYEMPFDEMPPYDQPCDDFPIAYAGSEGVL